MRLNYRGDCVSVIMWDSVHFLCFSNEKLVALENKAAEDLGASFIKLQRLESNHGINKETSTEPEQAAGTWNNWLVSFVVTRALMKHVDSITFLQFGFRKCSHKWLMWQTLEENAVIFGFFTLSWGTLSIWNSQEWANRFFFYSFFSTIVFVRVSTVRCKANVIHFNAQIPYI